MTIRDFRDLQCWQQANKLRQEIIAICEQAEAADDRRFCSGFMNAAGSVCRNLSEGFGRFESVYIVQFFGYALASLAEVQDYLEECRLRRFIDHATFERLRDLADHAKAAALKFQRSHRARIGKQSAARRARRT